MPIDYRGSGYHMRSRLSVPHSQSIHPSTQDGVQTLKSNGIKSIHARDLLVKPTGLISKNDMISMRSPSSNAIIMYHINIYTVQLTLN